MEKEFNLREKADIVSLAQEAAETLKVQNLIDYFTTKLVSKSEKSSDEILRESQLNKKVKRATSAFFSDIVDNSVSTNRLNMLRITNIESELTEKGLKVAYTLERPGLLIGKAGSIINELKSILEKELEMELEIEIHQSKLWANMYD